VAWLVAGGASLAAWKWLPPNSHVVAGALAGGVVGFFWLDKPARKAAKGEEEAHHGD